MQRLIEGIHRFRSEVFASQRELFERLAGGQRPGALFITCSDSRISPNLLTQTLPGELFILRNAGNIVPPYNGTDDLNSRRGSELPLDGADADALDEVALEEEEDDDHRDGGDGRAGHQHAEVGVELALEGCQADLDGVLEGVAQHH